MDQDTLLDTRIASLFPDMSRSQKELARFILDNGLFVAYASAAELGGKVGVSAATVVRFCQILGYEGYPELQNAVRASLPTYVNKVQQIEQGRGIPDKQHLAERVFGLDIQNLTRTRESLDQERFWAAVAALGKASDILVVGGGTSAGTALYLAHSLKVMGLEARAVLDGGIPLALELVRLKPTSVFIGISVWRYVAETIHAMEQAASRGATRIAITDSIVSPLAQRADYAFQVATDGAAHALSLTGAVALINAFIAALSFERPAQTTRALQEVDAAYRTGKLLATE
ncbi:MAG: MurR/RpiR family transcriptional regulator [Chloroflexi bacterium]|nr:MurR/RpiR family transcriptional regulator [Chloroflexota bacterium]